MPRWPRQRVTRHAGRGRSREFPRGTQVPFRSIEWGSMTTVVVVGVIALVVAIVAWVTWRRVADERHSVQHHQSALETLGHVADRRQQSLRSTSAPDAAPRPSTRLRRARPWNRAPRAGPAPFPTPCTGWSPRPTAPRRGRRRGPRQGPGLVVGASPRSVGHCGRATSKHRPPRPSSTSDDARARCRPMPLRRRGASRGPNTGDVPIAAPVPADRRRREARAPRARRTRLVAGVVIVVGGYRRGGADGGALQSVRPRPGRTRPARSPPRRGARRSRRARRARRACSCRRPRRASPPPTARRPPPTRWASTRRRRAG